MSPFRPVPLAAVLLAAAAAAPARAQRPAGPAGAAAAPTTTAGDRVAAATIDRAAAAVRGARTVRAAFEQTLSNPATGNATSTTGTLALGRPNKLAVAFNTPGGDRVVIDGATLWVYVPSAIPGQVLKLPARGNAAQSLDALGELLTNPRSRYRVADAGPATVSGRATRAVLLTPKAEAAPITEAKVWVDDRDGAVRQLELTEPTGAVRTWRFTEWRPNAALPAGTFTFQVPPGVRVVDRPAMATGGTGR